MLDRNGNLLIAKNDARSIAILPAMANRHGLVTGATGTGKTVSLQTLAESFSALGVPVFITDIKGDVSGIAKPDAGNPRVADRVKRFGLAEEGFTPQGMPVCCWDLFGAEGHPLRTTISDMGPLLLGRLLDLNPTQQGVLQILFRIADDNGLLLLDLKDLRKLAEYVNDRRKDFVATHGNIAPASLGAIQRGLLTLEEQGGNAFFGEPALDVHDLIRRVQGKGVVNLMSATRLMQSPRVYAAFLLWLLADLYEKLPEAGDLPEPKLVLFFDEAHLIFSEAPKALLERIEQTVRLIRSKGVGVFFITQNPADIPETVLAQLGNRVQHALRAYTPNEQKAVRAAAGAFRANPAFKTEDAITALEVGEALVSCLDAKGIPQIVERAYMVPPQSRIGPLNDAERKEIVSQSPMRSRYEQAIDRESAYERLTQKINEQQVTPETPKPAPGRKPAETGGMIGGIMGDLAKKTGQSISRNIANTIGRSLIRGIMGSLFGGKK